MQQTFPRALLSQVRRHFDRACLFLILITGWLLRVAAFSSVPGGIQHDEVTEALHGYEVLAGKFQLYFYASGGFKGREPLWAYLQAPLLYLFGINLWSLRFLAVAAGLLTVPLTYQVGRSLFNRRVGLLAAFAVSISFWPLVMSRLGLRGTLVPPLSALAIYLLWRVVRRPTRWYWVVAAGLVLSLSGYAYLGGWAAIGAVALFFGYLALWHRGLLRAKRSALLWYGVTAGLALLPLSMVFLTQPSARERVQQLAPLVEEATRGKAVPLGQNILMVLASFSGRGDQFGLYNIPNMPLLPLSLALLFYVGVGISCWRWRKPAYPLLLVWVVAGLLPAALSLGGPNNLRSVVSLPATYLLVALGATVLVELSARIRVPRVVPAVLVAGMLAWAAQSQITDFFLHWPANPDTRFFFRTTLAEAARAMPTDGRNCVSTPYPHDLSQWVTEYTQGRNPNDICWFRGTAAIVFPAGSGTARWYVPAGLSSDAALAAAESSEFLPVLGQLLGGGVTEQEAFFPDNTRAYRFYTTTDREELRARALTTMTETALAWSADAEGVRDPQPLGGPAHFDGGLTLLGARYLKPSAGCNCLETLLYWRVDVAHPEPAPFSLFLQLLDGQGSFLVGNDHLDYAVNSWQAGDVFVQYHRLALPAGIAPGQYYLQAGVYNWQTNVRWSLMQQGQVLGDRVVLPPVAVP